MHPQDDPPPQPPQKPDPADCCGGGCVTCVHDAYEAALERYEERRVAWQARQPRQPQETTAGNAS